MVKRKIKNKHNKKRNTAFLFEILITEIAKVSMSGEHEKRKAILSIIKEFFAKGKPLHKELSLYRTLQKTKCRDYNVASRFLNETKKEYAVVISNEDIYNEQSRLIKTINKKSTSMFKNFVPNYKNLASIYQIFNSSQQVKSRVIFEEKFVESLCHQKPKDDKLEQMDSLTYKFFLKKFNEQYGSSLLENQKKILTYYIMSFSDNGITLNSYLNEEIRRLRKVISESKEINEDVSMKKESEKIINFLDTFKDKKINESMMQKIIELQSLEKEITSEENCDEN